VLRHRENRLTDRLNRGAPVKNIARGTTEIMKEIIAKRLGA